MGKAKKTRKFAVAKKIIGGRDTRVNSVAKKAEEKARKKESAKEPRQIEQASSALWFQYNTQLGPPYHVLVDTNFINFSIKNKMDIVRSMMDCLLAKCIPCITDCVMAELEKLGSKYRVALRMAKDPRFERIPCSCKGVYADDCLVNMATQWRCFIVATCDSELRRRVRKIPGKPCLFIFFIAHFVDELNAIFM